MSDVEEIRIVSNKIDRLEDFALPSQNSVKSLILEGNHILEGTIHILRKHNLGLF